MSSTTKNEVFEAINQAYDVFENFSPEQKQIIENKKIIGKHSPTEWLSLVSELMKYDQAHDELVDKVKNIRWRNLSRNIGCLGVGIFIITTMVLEGFLEIGIPVIYYIGFLGIVIIAPILHRISPQGQLLATLNTKLKKLENVNLPNFFRDIIVPILVILREEMRANQPLLLEVNLDSPAFHTGEDTLKPGFVTKTNYHLKSTKYSEHVWFKFSGKLHDGSAIRCEVNHVARERYFVKHKRKGNKTKYKYNIKLTHDIRLVLPKSEYQYQPSDDKTFQYTETEKAHVFRLKSPQKIKGSSMVAGNNLPSSLDRILGHVKHIYTQVKPVNA
jgi:hypothetical protein